MWWELAVPMLVALGRLVIIDPIDPDPNEFRILG